MSRTCILRTTGRAVSLAAVLALAIGSPALAATPTDAWITTKVKISLATTEGIHPTQVHVDTVDRKVTLHGTVTTAEEKQTAERTAKSVKGTAGVRNLLQVVAATDEAAVDVKDDAIQQNVTAALVADASLKDSTISVQSVNKGVVLLQGKTVTLSDHLTALQIAGGVPGVRRVASEVESEETLTDADIWMEPNVAVAKAAPQTVRSATNDLYITSMVKMRLLANAETPAMDINVDTDRGVVTLFGIVPSAASKTMAAVEAGKAGGVTSVRNDLQVVATAKQPAVEAKDDVVQTNVARNLGERYDFQHVTCEVKNCVARLTGNVASGVDRLEAMQVARATKGVCSVTNDLTIR
jgi:hyperosmotically inducible periplasmic protein